jgi:hypothetical protein
MKDSRGPANLQISFLCTYKYMRLHLCTCSVSYKHTCTSYIRLYIPGIFKSYMCSVKRRNSILRRKKEKRSAGLRFPLCILHTVLWCRPQRRGHINIESGHKYLHICLAFYFTEETTCTASQQNDNLNCVMYTEDNLQYFSHQCETYFFVYGGDNYT